MSDELQAIINNPTIVRIIVIVAGSVIISLLVKIIKKSFSPHIKADNWYKTKKAINIFGYFLVVALILFVYSDQLGGVGVALGVASAGIAFALQEVITSVAGWLAILVGNFYKTGDRVQVGGIKGDVIDLGILRTTVMELGEWVDGDLYNGRIVRIANSFVFKEPVFNYSTDFPFLWDEIKIPVKFSSDYSKAKTIIEDVARDVIGDYCQQAQEHWKKMVRKYMIENASTDTMVTMVATDNWIEFTVRYVVDYQRRRTTKNQLFTAILTALNEAKEDIQLASATMDISAIPPIHISIDEDLIRQSSSNES